MIASRRRPTRSTIHRATSGTCSGCSATTTPPRCSARCPANGTRWSTSPASACRVAPAEGEWSVFGCLAHVVDAEVVMSARYRWIVVAHDEPQLLGYDQDLWVQRLHADPQRDRPRNCSRMFAALREANIAMWHRSTEADNAPGSACMPSAAPESYDLSFRMIAGTRPVPSASGEGRAASRSGGLMFAEHARPHAGPRDRPHVVGRRRRAQRLAADRARWQRASPGAAGGTRDPSQHRRDHHRRHAGRSARHDADRHGRAHG